MINKFRPLPERTWPIPFTGRTVNVRLGSDRQLKTIYSVNMRSAFQKLQYERAMASDLHYLLYWLVNSREHREEHIVW